MHRDRAVVPAGDYAVIRVSDTGVRHPSRPVAKIFEPFFTTKRVGEGTGLGLSTAYGIVKQSGGFIFVDSTEGEGTVFHLYFPIYKGSEAAAAAKPIRAPVLRQGEGVVLLVEDEAPVRAFASRALRMRGFTVLEAEDAERALNQLEDPNLEIDIFVTDVVMPGMDGPSWVREALKAAPECQGDLRLGLCRRSTVGRSGADSEFDLPAQAVFTQRSDRDRAGPVSVRRIGSCDRRKCHGDVLR